MAWLSQQPGDLCLERLAWEARRLWTRDREWTGLSQAKKAAQSDQMKSERGFSFVFIAGALEDYFRTLDEQLLTDLRRVEFVRHRLGIESLILLFPKLWSGVASDRVSRFTSRRALLEVFQKFWTSDFEYGVELPDKKLGMVDGRTVQPHHFEVLWEGLTLSASGHRVWISDAHRNSVSTVSDKRNTIAHFNTDPRDEAARLSYADIARHADRIHEQVERLQEALLAWLDANEIPVGTS